MSIIARRVAAKIDGDFVVFLIGARVNRWWKFPKHFWLSRTMPKMLAELEKQPESGFLGYEQFAPMVHVQYWRSLDQLIAYARNRDATHFPYWVKFNKTIGTSGDVGIWHESYQVRAGEYECIYSCMPPFGLGKAGGNVDATDRMATAAGRLSRSDGKDAPPETNVL